MKVDSTDVLYDVDQVASALNVSPSTVWRLIRAGELGHVRIATQIVRVSSDQLTRFVTDHRYDPDGID